MAVKQVSVFVSNTTGGVADAVEVLGTNGVNIRALSIADTSDFGILRLIADNTEEAVSVLQKSGYICQVTEVLAVSVADCPGGLSQILRILADARIDIEYLYVFVARHEGNAYAILKLADQEESEVLLNEKGVHLVSIEELCNI